MPRPGSNPLPATVGASIRTVDEASMVDTCTITRPHGPATYNAGLDRYVDGLGAAVYAGACRLVEGRPTEQAPTFGDQRITLTRYFASIPVAGTEVKVDDLFKVTAAGDPALSPLVGRTYRVAAVAGHETVASSRMLTLEDRRP